MDHPVVPAHGFATDLAKRYFAEFLADPSLDFVDDTFEVDADDLEEIADALLASELVAAATGRAAKDLPEDVRAAAKALKTPNKKTLAKARTAVRAVLEPTSKLRAHWTETGVDTTLASVKDLIDRLT